MATQFKTEKGKNGLAYRGYTYRFGKRNNDKSIFWRCLYSKICPGTLKTDEHKQNLFEKNCHNHLPQPEAAVVREVRNSLRERAHNETTLLPTIYRQETNRLVNNAVAAAIMPVYASVSSTMYR